MEQKLNTKRRMSFYTQKLYWFEFVSNFPHDGTLHKMRTFSKDSFTEYAWNSYSLRTFKRLIREKRFVLFQKEIPPPAPPQTITYRKLRTKNFPIIHEVFLRNCNYVKQAHAGKCSCKYKLVQKIN